MTNDRPAMARIAEIFTDAFRRHHAGHLQDAEQGYRQVLQLNPHHSDAWHLLGVIALQDGRQTLAVDWISTAIGINDNEAVYHANLGVALRQVRRLEDAVLAFAAALRLNDDDAPTHCNLGVALRELGRHEDAIAAYRAALCMTPADVNAHSNLGNCLRDLGRCDEAMRAYQTALAIAPNYAQAHHNLAITLLLTGRFRDGWAQYEWRWRTNDFLPYVRPFAQPVWQGEDLTGKTILLHAEQGMGDTIQFCRYVALVAARGGRVLLEVHPPLTRLLAGLAGAATIIAKGDVLPPFDLHCPLMSLPRAFDTASDTIPAAVPYLAAEPELVELWRQRLPRADFRIGIVWQGSPTYVNDRNRSIPLECFAPLARLDGVTLISLQKRHGVEQLQRLPDGMTVATLADEFDEGADAFIDSAAVMMSLDLIITVDTAIGHLAGALGRPTWIALQHVPHWVWLMQGDYSRWYPTVRLFRQQEAGNWSHPFSRMAEALRAGLHTSAARSGKTAPPDRG
jgi:Flp pilus assembly protein TadD